jgi:hypothetical protein
VRYRHWIRDSRPSCLAPSCARNYNLDCKNPHIGEQEIHDPDVLLTQYNAMQKDIAALRGQLKGEICLKDLRDMQLLLQQ